MSRHRTPHMPRDTTLTAAYEPYQVDVSKLVDLAQEITLTEEELLFVGSPNVRVTKVLRRVRLLGYLSTFEVSTDEGEPVALLEVAPCDVS